MQMPYYMGGVDPASLSAPVSRGWCCERAKDGGSVPSRVFPSSDLSSPPRPPCLRLGPGAAGRGGKRRRAQRCAPWRKRAGGGGAEGQGETRRSHVCALQVAFALAFLSLQPSLSLQLSLLLCSVSVSLSLSPSLSLSLSLSPFSLPLRTAALQHFSRLSFVLRQTHQPTPLPPSSERPRLPLPRQRQEAPLVDGARLLRHGRLLPRRCARSRLHKAASARPASRPASPLSRARRLCTRRQLLWRRVRRFRGLAAPRGHLQPPARQHSAQRRHQARALYGQHPRRHWCVAEGSGHRVRGLGCTRCCAASARNRPSRARAATGAAAPAPRRRSRSLADPRPFSFP